MAEAGRDRIVIFAESLARSVADVLGRQAVTGMFARTFPHGEVSLTAAGRLAVAMPAPKETVRTLAAALADMLAAGLGTAFAERALAEAYADASVAKTGFGALADVLACVPDGFLEEERVKALSKTELEIRILQRTAELREANALLEARVASRTQELQEANRKLKDANQTLQRMSSAKSEFLSMVSHQLLVPLTAARWITKTIEEILSPGMSDEARTLLQQMLSNNSHMARLVANLLNVARIEEGRFDYKMDLVPLAALLHEIVADVTPIATEKGVTLRCAAEDIGTIRGDRDKLRMAFENLIENAVKYTPEGKMVIVTLAGDGDGALVKIADQGIGIPAEEHAQIFDKFFRARNARSSDVSGSGLGLFVVRQVVTGHRGSIRFESAEGKGAVFFVNLPLAV